MSWLMRRGQEDPNPTSHPHPPDSVESCSAIGKGSDRKLEGTLFPKWRNNDYWTREIFPALKGPEGIEDISLFGVVSGLTACEENVTKPTAKGAVW